MIKLYYTLISSRRFAKVTFHTFFFSSTNSESF